MVEFPYLPGTPLTQAVALAEWAMYHDNLAISEAGLGLFDALYNDPRPWWELSGPECLDAANDWTALGQLELSAQCRTWATAVLAWLDELFRVVSAEDPEAAEVFEAAGQGAAAQVAEARNNWLQFAGATKRGLNVGALVAAGLVAAFLWRATA